MELIYGSTAIKFWFPDFRNPKDLDIISDGNKKTTKGIEYYWNEAFTYLKFLNIHFRYVDANLLYTIKLSHLSYDINWDKHMKDSIFLKSKGCKIDKLFYDVLLVEWDKIHGKKKVKLNCKNKDFFKDNIKRRFNHDYLHEKLSFFGIPLNEKIRRDLNFPKCDEELFNQLSYDNKIKLALEELFVLTAERYVFIDKPLPFKFARIKMLKQMITSTTTGWFNLFLKENFKELLDFDTLYVEEKILKLTKNETL